VKDAGVTPEAAEKHQGDSGKIHTPVPSLDPIPDLIAVNFGDRSMTTDLQKMLFDHFGSDLGIGRGTLKREDPLIITDSRNYVSIEYAIAEWALDDEEFSLEQQLLHDDNDRVIDELVYATKPKGAPQWVNRRRFFFDITAGVSLGIK
jgi:hypothetical protein